MERRDNEFRTSVERLPADHGRDSLPPAGPSGPAAGLHLAGLRPGATLSRTAPGRTPARRSEEHTSELQSLMRISYAVFCLKKKKSIHIHKSNNHKHTTNQLAYS